MSVLVRGMEMPEYCWDCPCQNKESGYCQINPNLRSELRPAICPLIEVPTPHGRLIDADDLKKLPSAEPKMGRWVDGRVAFFLTCSKCGCHVRKNISVVFEGKGALNYCPNCGAKMEECE